VYFYNRFFNKKSDSTSKFQAQNTRIMTPLLEDSLKSLTHATIPILQYVMSFKG